MGKHGRVPQPESRDDRGREERMKKVLLAFALVLGVTTSASAQEDVAAFYKGKTIRLVVGIGGRLGLRHQRATAGAPHGRACARRSDHHRAEPARCRQPHHDQRALQCRAVRRHRVRRLLQRHADHAAVAARRRPLRSGEAQLARQHQPRNAGALMCGTPRRCKASPTCRRQRW